MKNMISISSIIENAVNEREIPYRISLNDASRMFTNAKGSYDINPTLYYSGRVRAYQDGDRVISFPSKRRLNLDELRRILEQFVGKGPVEIRVNGRIIKGELVK